MKENVNVVDLEEVQAFLSALAERIAHIRPALSEIGQIVQNVTEESFDSGVSPWGEVWLPLAPSTLRRKGVEAGAPMSTGKLLYETGRMRESLYRSVDPDGRGVTIGLNAKSADGYPYPAVHQFGTEDGRIPARPFLPVDAAGRLPHRVAEEILATLAEYVDPE